MIVLLFYDIQAIPYIEMRLNYHISPLEQIVNANNNLQDDVQLLVDHQTPSLIP